MSSRCRDLLVALMLLLAAGAACARELTVCADPDNLPYSRRDGSGFENRIAAILARTLGADLRFAWVKQGHGYVRKTLKAHVCDVLMGVPAGFDPVRATRAYYRSTYAAVTRAADAFTFRGFDDPRLESMKIGVQLVGDDLAATPPGHALALHGLVDNVTGYTVYGDGPQAERMIADLAHRRIDLALVWGPQAGYFAAHAEVPMRLALVAQPAELPKVPFAYSIAMGVRKQDRELQQALDDALARSRREVDAVLRDYRVPRLADTVAAKEDAR